MGKKRGDDKPPKEGKIEFGIRCSMRERERKGAGRGETKKEVQGNGQISVEGKKKTKPRKQRKKETKKGEHPEQQLKKSQLVAAIISEKGTKRGSSSRHYNGNRTLHWDQNPKKNEEEESRSNGP